MSLLIIKVPSEKMECYLFVAWLCICCVISWYCTISRPWLMWQHGGTVPYHDRDWYGSMVVLYHITTVIDMAAWWYCTISRPWLMWQHGGTVPYHDRDWYGRHGGTVPYHDRDWCGSMVVLYHITTVIDVAAWWYCTISRPWLIWQHGGTVPYHDRDWCGSMVVLYHITTVIDVAAWWYCTISRPWLTWQHGGTVPYHDRDWYGSMVVLYHITTVIDVAACGTVPYHDRDWHGSMVDYKTDSVNFMLLLNTRNNMIVEKCFLLYLIHLRSSTLKGFIC